MTDIQQYESDGWFWLSYYPAGIQDGGIWRGCGLKTIRFYTDEGRTYYMSMVDSREKMGQRIADLESELRYLKTVRGANENLRAVRAKGRASRG